MGGALQLELLGVPVEIACGDPSLRARLELCYAHSLRSECADSPLRASLSARDATFAIRVEGREDTHATEPITAVRTFNHELLHGLAAGWRFGFETTASRAAVCRHRDKTIAMSLSYALRAPWHEIVATLLHEIAHAIVGPHHKHDRVWKAKAREIGCTAERCTSLQHSVGGWLGRCNTCRRTWTRHRLTTKMRTRSLCPRCKTRITWQRNSDGTTASAP